MNWVDYCIIFVFLVSVLMGVWRGFTREILSLGTWVLAFVATWLLSPGVAQRLEPHLADPTLREAAAAGIVFILALFVGAVVTHFLVVAVRDSRFSPADRTLGGGLGLLRAFIVMSLFVLVAVRMGAGDDRWWHESVLLDQFRPLAHGLESIIPERWLTMLKPALPPTHPSGQ